MSGRYIAFEGVEGAGKSTVADRLAETLLASGTRLCRVREPGGTATGELIRGVLLEPGGDLAPWTEALLFAAGRAQLIHDVVRPALDRGETVISDRSVFSSLAYQGGGRGLGVDEVRELNRPGLEGTWPDLVVLLRIDAQAGLVRQEVADRIGGEGVAFQRRASATFDDLARDEPDRFWVVDASVGIDDVVAAVVAEVSKRW
jgi:dTMP kinase